MTYKERFLLDVEKAKKDDKKYLMLEIEMPGSNNEFIVNTRPSFENKAKYIDETYDDEMCHKRAKDIKIIGFIFTNEGEDIINALSNSYVTVNSNLH